MFPIHEALPALKAALAERNTAVLVAPPGAGKTTVVPLELLAEPWMSAGKIIVLYPTTAEFRGKMGPAMRVRIPPPKDSYRASPKPAPKPPVDEEIDGFDEPEQLDDDISDVR